MFSLEKVLMNDGEMSQAGWGENAVLRLLASLPRDAAGILDLVVSF